MRGSFLAPDDAYRTRIQNVAIEALDKLGIGSRSFMDADTARRWLRETA